MRKTYNKHIKRFLKMDYDKFLHFIGGIGIVALFAVFGGALLGLTIAVLIGFLKEYVWDGALKKGAIEVADFVATVGGGALAYLAILHPILILAFALGYCLILYEEKKSK